MSEQPSGARPVRTQIKVELPADLAAQYVNFALITQTLSEVILDFAQVLPNTPKARIQVRLVLTPTNAKLLYKALGESLDKHEGTHGEIKVPPTLADQLFQSLRAEPAAGGPTSGEDAPPGNETPPDEGAPEDKAGDGAGVDG